jgi:hypothetical protein
MYQSPDSGGLVTTTVRDYDLSETSKLVRHFFFLNEIGIWIYSANFIASCCVLWCRHDGLLPSVHEVHPASLHSSPYGSEESIRCKACCHSRSWEARRGRSQETVQDCIDVRRHVNFRLHLFMSLINNCVLSRRWSSNRCSIDYGSRKEGWRKEGGLESLYFIFSCYT